MNCLACEKSYNNLTGLKQHLDRQPICKKWIEHLEKNPIANIVNEYKSEEEDELKCTSCNQIFSNKGNLNKHYKNRKQCYKWKKFDEFSEIYEKFEAPKYKLCHIIWNIFLIDKEFQLTQEIINENNIGYIVALLPDEQVYKDKVTIDIPHNILLYNSHTPFLDIEIFNQEIKKIEQFRKERKNIFVFCNNGYQRSIPFLIYYLIKFHYDEVPTIEKALDIILPQVDKENYSKIRQKYIDNMSSLFSKIDLTSE